MKIAVRLYLFAIGGILGLMLMGGLGLYKLSSFNELVSGDFRKVGGVIEEVANLKSAEAAFKTQVQEWKNILLRGNRVEDYDKHLKQFDMEEAKVQALLKSTADAFRANGQMDRVTATEALMKSHQSLGVSYREALKGYDRADLQAGNKVDKAVKGMDRDAQQRMQELVGRIQKEENEHIQQQIAESMALYAESRNSLLLIACLVIVGALLTAVLIVRSIRLALDQMQQTVAAIPQTWNLRMRVAAHGEDEIAQTGRAINRMLESFQEVVGSIVANAQRTAESCRSMANSLHEIEQASGQQNDATSTMAAAVEELTTSFAQIHSNANESLAATSDASQSALQGDRVIGEASGAMSGIVDSVQGAAAVIERVGLQSRDISTIVQVIREVADQTNLLALNAAIEAARAGEQGRGFAVVADEVRKLAEKTTSSAEEITRMIEAVQQSAGNAVSDIRTVVEEVQRINTHAQEARSSMEEIRGHTEKSEGFSRDITYALGEQSAASTLIAQNVETIARMSDENAGNISRAEKAMRELEAESKALQEAVARFTV